MGLLEDAIREHLELKRRRGASNEEVSQQEREALGPPGRPTPLEETAAAHAAELTDEPAAVEAPRESVPPPPAAQPFDAQAAEPEPDEVPAEDDGPTQLYDDAAADDLWEEPEPAPPRAAAPAPTPREREREPEPESPEPEPDPDEPAAVAAPPDPPAAPAREGEEAEDVLEETPEFLQETPEHDRLWFEQKPPRDFDFGN